LAVRIDFGLEITLGLPTGIGFIFYGFGIIGF
jgi:hypothetical protein